MLAGFALLELHDFARLIFDYNILSDLQRTHVDWLTQCSFLNSAKAD
jgi:hypothetical protein